MRFEMNIGLDVGSGIVGANSYYNRVMRLRKARSLAYRCADWVESVKEIGELSGGSEPCLYVRGRIDSFTSLDSFCFDLCRVLEQDCVAVVDLDSGKGELIGPNAAAWGEFNPEYFRRPSKVAVAA
jgi:hypothetical protein